MRATRLAYLDLARNMFCKKWAELRGNTPLVLSPMRNVLVSDSNILLLHCVFILIERIISNSGKDNLAVLRDTNISAETSVDDTCVPSEPQEALTGKILIFPICVYGCVFIIQPHVSKLKSVFTWPVII